MWCVHGCGHNEFNMYPQNPNDICVWKAADMLTLLKQTLFPNHVVCEMLLNCWLWLKRLNFPTMWCVHMGFFSIYPLNTNSIYVWKAADILTLLRQNTILEQCGVWIATDMLPCFEETKFPNYVVCEKPLTCWLCWIGLNFRTIWCVKGCWHADIS